MFTLRSVLCAAGSQPPMLIAGQALLSMGPRPPTFRIVWRWKFVLASAPLPGQILPFPVRAPRFLVGLARDRNHRTDRRFAPQPSHQGAQQHLGIDHVGSLPVAPADPPGRLEGCIAVHLDTASAADAHLAFRRSTKDNNLSPPRPAHASNADQPQAAGPPEPISSRPIPARQR